MRKSIIWNVVKKYCLKFFSVGLVFSMAAGWWGILYPQLTLNADTCRVISQDGVVISEEDEDWEADSALYLEMLNADRNRLRFRFRFVEDLMKCLKRVRGN